MEVFLAARQQLALRVVDFLAVRRQLVLQGQDYLAAQHRQVKPRLPLVALAVVIPAAYLGEQISLRQIMSLDSPQEVTLLEQDFLALRQRHHSPQEPMPLEQDSLDLHRHCHNHQQAEASSVPLQRLPNPLLAEDSSVLLLQHLSQPILPHHQRP